MTHKERMLLALKGEFADCLAFAPRLDLWHFPNAKAGTLPERHKGRTADEIALSEGWPLHHVVVDYFSAKDPDALLHRAIGVHRMREHPFRVKFSDRINIEVKRNGPTTKVTYHTPLGTLKTMTELSDEMKMSGVAVPWIKEHIVKSPEDLALVECLFENMDVIHNEDEFVEFAEEIGDDGLVFTTFTNAASPMHHIQKYFLDNTEFFIFYREHYGKLSHLAQSMESFYEKGLSVIAGSSVEVVNWGANFDDTLTFPPYFKKEIVPWLQKAARVLAENGKYLSSHCDGENRGLLDLIKESNIHMAESVCPHPMTKVSINDYYRTWCDKLTIFGGIPSNLLLRDTCSDEDFESFLNEFFRAITPGNRFIVGVADSVPPESDFERLVYLGERIRKEGKLPLQAGSFNPMAGQKLMPHKQKKAEEVFAQDDPLTSLRQKVLDGNVEQTLEHIKELLAKGYKAQAILQGGMLSAMEIIGGRFKDGSVFIPEVLMSAKAMNTGVVLLEPELAKGGVQSSGKIILGTVKGDLHDIGKNIVQTMLRGVGYDVIDLGINVPEEKFIEEVGWHKPDILGLSALLTTTMPQMKNVILKLKEAGLREQVKVIVGGAPVSQQFANNIGADGYASDAGEAIELVRNFKK